MAKPSETLSIDGFGGLKDAQIDLRPFTLLIGPQGSGKSIITKLLHFFKKVPSDVFQSASSGQSWKDFSSRAVQRFLKYFPAEAWPKKSFKITLENLDATYTVESNRKLDSGVEIQFPNFLHTELDELKHSMVDPELTEASFVARARKHLGRTMCYHQRLIPAGRSFFATFEDNIFSFASDKIEIDPFLAEFGHYYRKLLQSSSQNGGTLRTRKLLDSAQPLIQSILKGKHQREEKRDFVLMPDGRKTPLRCGRKKSNSVDAKCYAMHIIGHQLIELIDAPSQPPRRRFTKPPVRRRHRRVVAHAVEPPGLSQA